VVVGLVPALLLPIQTALLAVRKSEQAAEAVLAVLHPLPRHHRLKPQWALAVVVAITALRPRRAVPQALRLVLQAAVVAGPLGSTQHSIPGLAVLAGAVSCASEALPDSWPGYPFPTSAKGSTSTSNRRNSP
jgi:hypothetical protein